MAAALARCATRVSGYVGDLEQDEAAFTGALLTLASAAVAFSVWVAVTPPRVEALLVDVDRASVFVADLPPLVLPIPVPVEHVAAPAGPAEPAPAPRARPAPAPARSEGPDAADAAPRSLLLDRIGTLGRTDDPLSTLLREDPGGRAMQLALDGVSGARVAEAGDTAPRRGTRDAEREGLALERAGGGVVAGFEGGAIRVPERAQVAAVNEAEVDTGDAAAIARVVRANQGRVQTCAEQSLKQDPSMSGRLELGWSIAAGRVTEVTVVRNTTGRPAFATCMEGAVRSMRFPPGLTAEVARFPWVVSGK